MVRDHNHAVGVTSSPLRGLWWGIIATSPGDAKNYDSLMCSWIAGKQIQEQNWEWPLAQEISEAARALWKSLTPGQSCPLCSSLGSPPFPGRIPGQKSTAWFTKSDWIWNPDWFCLPWFTLSSLQDPSNFIQAVLPKVSLTRLTEPYRAYHDFSLVLLKLLDVCPCRWLPSGRNVFCQSRKIPS